jgi:hypothetical protein
MGPLDRAPVARVFASASLIESVLGERFGSASFFFRPKPNHSFSPTGCPCPPCVLYLRRPAGRPLPPPRQAPPPRAHPRALCLPCVHCILLCGDSCTPTEKLGIANHLLPDASPILPPAPRFPGIAARFTLHALRLHPMLCALHSTLYNPNHVRRLAACQMG